MAIFDLYMWKYLANGK